jgi:hypothetical protein
MTPADVAAEVEQQACQFHREATAQLTLAASHLGHAAQLMAWTPADIDAIEAALDLHAARVAEGLRVRKLAAECFATGQAIRAQQSAKPQPPSVPPSPTDRNKRLDHIAATMASTADDARGDLEALSSLLRNSTPGNADDLCAVMEAVNNRVEQLRAYFTEAAEVSTCSGSA